MSASFLVNEIYPCLQGEGINLGKPSLLVRFQICNLRCSWCDTPFTHTFKSDPLETTNPNSKQKYKRYTLESLVKEIQTHNLNHLILSGGEPTLHNIGLLMRSLGNSYSAEVESNGTRIPHLQIPNFLEHDYHLMQWNISPKFSNSGEEINTDALKHWSKVAEKHDSVFFKFVIRKNESNKDIQEVLSILKEFNIKNDRVFLMAEGITVDSQIANIWLHDACLKYGFKYTPRLHIILFGNKRGV